MDFGLALQQQLSERQLKKGRTERIYSRKMIEQAFLESFELIGGIPRLAIWGNEPENYGEFLKLLTKLIPKEQLGEKMGQVLEYRSNVPPSPLNRSAPEQRIDDIEDGELIITQEPE